LKHSKACHGRCHARTLNIEHHSQNSVQPERRGNNTVLALHAPVGFSGTPNTVGAGSLFTMSYTISSCRGIGKVRSALTPQDAGRNHSIAPRMRSEAWLERHWHGARTNGHRQQTVNAHTHQQRYDGGGVASDGTGLQLHSCPHLQLLPTNHLQDSKPEPTPCHCLVL
jgi:hypothetical protein